MNEFFQHLINGLSLGGMYALLAVGYSLVFGVLRMVHFAHGDVYMVGALTGVMVTRALKLSDNPSLGSLMIVLTSAMAVCAVLGFLIERLAYRPLRNAPRIHLLITSIGVSMLIQFSAQLIAGPDPLFFPNLYSGETEFSFLSLKMTAMQAVVLGAALVLMLVLQFFVSHTRTGRSLQAVSFNHELASLMGISTNKAVSLTFMLSSALAGAAGVLIGQIYPKVEPFMGVMPGLKCFSAAVLGGMGSITGAVTGALLLGLSETFLVGYGSSTYRDALAFILLLGVLLFRPNGILSKATQEKV